MRRASASTAVSIGIGITILGVSYQQLRAGALANDWSYPAIALKIAILLVALGFIVTPVILLFRGSADRRRAIAILQSQMMPTIAPTQKSH